MYQFLIYYIQVESVEQHVEAGETGEKASAFVQEVADRMPQEMKKLPTPTKPGDGLSSSNRMSNMYGYNMHFVLLIKILCLSAVASSPDPTPERNAVLQAGLTALLRAKDTPVQTPGVC